MRHGITLQEVSEAAESLQIQGDNPTIDRIREFLGGTGSNTTISKYLNAWRMQRTTPNNNEKSSPPDLVHAAVKRVWQELRDETNVEIEKIKSEANEHIEKAVTQAKEAEENYIKLQNEHTELHRTYQQLAAEKELLLIDLKNLREEYNLLNEKYGALDSRYIDMQGTADKLLKDLSNYHQCEIVRLEEKYQQQDNNHNRHISDMKTQYEVERHQYITLIDSLKMSNQKKEVEIDKFKNQLKENEVRITELIAKNSAIESEKNLVLQQLNKQDSHLKELMDKILIGSDTADKLNSIPTLASHLEKIDGKLNQTLNHKLDDILVKLNKVIEQQAETIDE